MSLSRCVFLFAVLLVLSNFGCGQKGPKLVKVSGTVNYDGKPLEKGFIGFATTSKNPQVYSSEVKAGAYALESETGDVIVKVVAEQDVPGAFDVAADGTKNPVKKNYIPAKFNEQSELKYKVPEAGARDANFDLKP